MSSQFIFVHYHHGGKEQQLNITRRDEERVPRSATNTSGRTSGDEATDRTLLHGEKVSTYEWRRIKVSGTSMNAWCSSYGYLERNNSKRR